MQKVSRQYKWRNAVFFITPILIVCADQSSKAWISTNVARGQAIFDIGFFRITHINNTGAAFGLFQDHTLTLTIVACIGIVAILYFALFANRHFPVIESISGKLALGLILGGTVGNLIDRLRQGYVTDFIDFNLWPTFNVADSAVTIGVIILVYGLLRSAITEKH